MQTATKWAAAMAIAVAALGCSSEPPGASVDVKVPVTVRDVGVGDVEDRIVATGTLRATETVELRAESTGYLKMGTDSRGRRLVEGSRVSAGQPLATVTGEDVRLAARTDATRQSYEVAQRDFEQKKKLYEEGLISEAEFLPVESRLTDARFELERSELTESRSTLITPIGGVILKLARGEDNTPLADGQRIDQGRIVAQVVPTGALIGEIDLVGPDIARVEPGQPVRVRYFAWDDRIFEGQVLRLAPSLDLQTRTLRAEVLVKNTEGLLRPGMFVEVVVIAESRDGVPVVPRQAVAERGGIKVVFTVNGQAAKQNEVVLGLGDDEIVEVVSGIEVGDRIVVRGLETLNDGQKIRVTGS